MNHNESIAKVTGIITILSGFIAFASLIGGVIAVQYNFSAFSNPLVILTIPNISISSIRWFMLCDLSGYYLLLLPVIFYMHHWLKTKTTLASLITFCRIAYILIGAIGASILAVVWPSIISAFATSSPASQELLKMNFQMSSDMVYKGMWNLLEVMLGGIWWLGTGLFLRKSHKVFGWVTIVLGFFTLLDSIGSIFEMHGFSEIGLNVYLVLAPAWAIWFGAFLIRKSVSEKNGIIQHSSSLIQQRNRALTTN